MATLTLENIKRAAKNDGGPKETTTAKIRISQLTAEMEAAGQGRVSPPTKDAKRIQELFPKGREKLRLFDTEGFEDAVAIFRQIIDKAPSYGPAHAGIAEAYSYWGFRRELNGDESASYYALALQHAQQAGFYAPDRGDSHRALAVALRRGAAADPERRKEEILIALDLEPNSGENWYEHWRAFGYDPSEPSIRRALELDPNLCGAYIDLGVVLCERDRLDEAGAYLLRALKINPRNSLALYNLAMVMDRKGDPASAVKVLGNARKMHPEDSLIRWAWSRFQGETA